MESGLEFEGIQSDMALAALSPDGKSVMTGLQQPTMHSSGEEMRQRERNITLTPTYLGLVEPKTPMSARGIIKNVWLINVVFLLLFTAFNGLAPLQSSLHIQQGMGVITQSLLYGTMALACLFVPTLVISKFGHKWTITVSIMGYIVWMAANGYAVWATMIPANCILGLAAATLWTSQSTCFTILAKRYAKLKGETEKAVIGRFFGMFFMMIQLSRLLGSSVSSIILLQTVANQTVGSNEVFTLCGPGDCPWNNVTNTNYDKPPSHIVWFLAGVCMGLCVLALALMFLVDPLPKGCSEKSNLSSYQKADNSLGSTIRQLKQKHMLMLIPISIYTGMHQTVLDVEYPKSYVTCAFGMWMIGFVKVPSGAVNAVVACTGGRLIKVTGRVPLFTIAFIFGMTAYSGLLIWHPRDTQYILLFAVPMCAAVTDGLLRAQVSALYGTIFPDNLEGAFSNFRLWQSIGLAVSFAYSSFLCTSTKIWLAMGSLVSGMLFYYIIEAQRRWDCVNHTTASR